MPEDPPARTAGGADLGPVPCPGRWCPPPRHARPARGGCPSSSCSASAWSSAPGPGSPAGARRRGRRRSPYVPADGDALWQRVDPTRETVTQTTTQVTESARFAGINGLISGDSFLVTRVLHQDFDQNPSERPALAHRPRPRSTTSASPARRSATTGSAAASSWPASGRPTEPSPRTSPRWSSCRPTSVPARPGAAPARPATRSTTRARSGPSRASGGCLEVSGELDLRPKGGPPAAVVERRSTRTWCPGRGVVAASESSGATAHGRSARSRPRHPDRAPTTGPTPVAWTDPRAWTPRTWNTVTVDADGRDPGDVRVARRPACTPVAHLVRPGRARAPPAGRPRGHHAQDRRTPGRRPGRRTPAGPCSASRRSARSCS